jgi:hypothetical protein
VGAILTLGELLKDYGAPVAWLVAVVGWIYANRQANRRETRKEIRGEIGDIAAVKDRVLDGLTGHGELESGSREASLLVMQVRVDLREIDLLFARLKSRHFRSESNVLMQSTARAVEEFFEFASGDSLEGRGRSSADDAECRTLARHLAGLAVIDALHNLFLSEFEAR